MSKEWSANSTVSHYRILEKLGAGGMGEVFLAEDTRLRRKIALKVLPENIAKDKDRLRRFEQEAFAASALNHPNILTVHEFGMENGVHFLATEFVEGQTLREWLQRERPTIDEILDIAIQTASALSAAHQAGIIHRDIKPENIMVRRDHLVKVLDFGLAKLSKRKIESADTEAETRALVETGPNIVMGTAAYMSPEQTRGKDADARTDIFSFGVVLYEMLSDRRPFTGETVSDVIAAILKNEPDPINSFNQVISAELERTVFKALAKDREERYQTAKDLLVDLKRLRKQLELTAEIERTKRRAESIGMVEKNPTQILAAQPSSSAEYIMTEIKRHKVVSIILSAIFLAAAGGLGFWLFSNRSFDATQIESIAVLPFENVSGNEDVEYLSDGITETLISSLSQLPNLNVKARSSVFHYKGKPISAQTIGKELNVQAILNGRVVQRGQDLTLYLELVDARTENVLWKENYNRSMTNLVTLQNDIARNVSQKLKAKLSGADEQRLAMNYTANPEAYQLYLKGRFFWNKRTVKDLQKAIEFFQRAVALDPNYALAYTGLADSYALLPTYGTTPPHEVMPKAREAALTALSLDGQLAEAHISLGLVFNYYDYDFARAERAFKTAIELNPNSATARHFYGNLLVSDGNRHEEAIAEIRHALEIDPLSPLINRQLAIVLFMARKYDDALIQLKKTLELDPNFAPAYNTLANVYQVKDEYDKSVEAFAKNQELIGEHQSATLMRESFARGGWHGFLRAMVGEERPSDFTSYHLATFYAALSEKELALAELERSFEKREFFLTLLKVDPRLDSLRDDPRFQELLRKLGSHSVN